MKKYFRSTITIGFLSVMVVGLVFALTGCGLFGGLPTAKITTDPALDNNTVSAAVDEDIVFEGSDSSSPNGDITEYEWNFDDGSAVVTGEVQTHSFSEAKTYSVELTVTDEDGKTDSDIVTADIGS